jgi:head-tail adaptor
VTALSSAELTQIRADVATLLPDTANILAGTLTPDGAGGQTVTWGTVAGTIACRLDPVRGREIDIGGQVQAFYGFVLTLPHGTTITAQHRVEVGGGTFAVVSADPEKSWKASVRAYVERE